MKSITGTATLFLSIFLLVGCQSQKTDALQDRIDQLLSQMTIAEKIGQMSQRGTSSRSKVISEELKQAIREGRVGSLLNVSKPEFVNELQRIAVEESANGIPIIFARDVIHGYKTIFPIPLGQAASWNPTLAERGSRVAAKEASSRGIRWTFAPMLDISRDPRWGRVSESAGEDPYLTEQFAKAYVKGFQTNNLNDPSSLISCGKHFVGYGAAEGGRDYNTAVISDPLLHNVYLRPFKATNDVGIATYMTSFNELNGVPASANRYILTDILRERWNFDGFVVSDWNSIEEMIAHGYSRDRKDAARSAANAMLDMEMTSTTYEDHLEELVENGQVSLEQLDKMVGNILRVKIRMGLFEKPYFKEDKSMLYREEHLDAAKKMALESMVLLKNEGALLPISSNKQVAVIGPLADAPHEQLGTWTFDGEKEHTVTPKTALEEAFDHMVFASGLAYSRDKSSQGFKAAISAARQSDIIVFVGGEESILSGEAHSRANINLPGAQEVLLNELAKTEKPIVLVIMAGRPITLGNIFDKVDAVLMAWHPGTMGGPALVDLLTGKESPSGRLPISWPKSVGQIPIYYNHKSTGRPAVPEKYVSIDSIPVGAWQSSLGNESHYLDDGYAPLYPFGYGLSYTSFSYRNLDQSAGEINFSDTLIVSAEIKNTGDITGSEVVQLYFQDRFASLTRPVRELIRFKKIQLAPGQSTKVTFKLTAGDFQFYNAQGQWVTEPGEFNYWIAPNAAEGLKGSFTLLE